jgi:hypothetical protein
MEVTVYRRVELVMIPLAVNVASSAAYDLIKKLVVRLP